MTVVIIGTVVRFLRTLVLHSTSLNFNSVVRLTEQINLMFNFSVAYKKPTILEKLTLSALGNTVTTTLNRNPKAEL